MDKIPKDLKRWLKDNGRYIEFIRLINLCDYTIDDLVHTHIISGKKDEYLEYGIKRWFEDLNDEKYVVTKDKNLLKYSDFLDKLKLNWK